MWRTVGGFWESTHGDCVYHFCHIHWSELIHMAIPNGKGAWEICTGSRVVAHGLSCCGACGIFLNQEDWTHVSYIGRWILYHWATRETTKRILELPGASLIKSLPAKQKKRAQSLGREDHLEKEMATHSSIIAWEIPRTEEHGGLQSMGSQRVRHNLMT